MTRLKPRVSFAISELGDSGQLDSHIGWRSGAYSANIARVHDLVEIHADSCVASRSGDPIAICTTWLTYGSDREGPQTGHVSERADSHPHRTKDGAGERGRRRAGGRAELNRRTSSQASFSGFAHVARSVTVLGPRRIGVEGNCHSPGISPRSGLPVCRVRVLFIAQIRPAWGKRGTSLAVPSRARQLESSSPEERILDSRRAYALVLLSL